MDLVHLPDHASDEKNHLRSGRRAWHLGPRCPSSGRRLRRPNPAVSRASSPRTGFLSSSGDCSGSSKTPHADAALPQTANRPKREKRRVRSIAFSCEVARQTAVWGCVWPLSANPGRQHGADINCSGAIASPLATSLQPLSPLAHSGCGLCEHQISRMKGVILNTYSGSGSVTSQQHQ
jgi:hypothetical protein